VERSQNRGDVRGFRGTESESIIAVLQFVTIWSENFFQKRCGPQNKPWQYYYSKR